MHSRIERLAPNLCEFITLKEVQIGGPLENSYHGAGAALIATKGDVIVDLLYSQGLKRDSEIAQLWAINGDSVWFGTCSCGAFCNPLELTNPTNKAETRRAMRAHALANNFRL